MSLLAEAGNRLRRIFGWLNSRPFAALPILSVIITFILEIFSRRGLSEAVQFLAGEPLMFLYNVFIVLLTLSVCMLAPRRVFAVCVVSAVWLILGFVNFLVLSYRTTPLGMIDLLLAGNAIKLINVYLEPWQILLIVLGAAVVIAGGIWLWKRSPRERIRPFRALAGTLSIACVLWIFSVSVTSADALSESFGNLAVAYDDLGFAYCFSTSVIDRGVEKPEDYSPESVSGICDELKTSTKGARPNVIIVQLESFFDPARYSGIELDENPIPNYTKLRSECSTGYLSMPSIGAGTANSEFEVLTGMNMDHFGAGEYPYKTILGSETCESLAYDFGSIGYTSTAIHNHIRTFYGRDKVFENLGFDEFISVEDMGEVDRTPTGWATDEVLTGEIISALDASDGRDFIYTITVQAHGRYSNVGDEDETNLPSEEDGDADMAEAWAYYAEQLSGTDRFIGELISALRGRDEPTVVVFFGDHLPSLEIDESLLDDRDQFTTEYMIWSNIGLAKQSIDLQAYQLGAYVQSRLGLCLGPIPALHQRYFRSGSPDDYQHALQTLEYDMLYGEKYIFDGSDGYIPTDLSRKS